MSCFLVIWSFKCIVRQIDNYHPASELRFLQLLGVLCHGKSIKELLYVSVKKRLEIIGCEVYAVVCDAPLGEIVGAYFAERSPVDTSVLRREAISSTYF